MAQYKRIAVITFICISSLLFSAAKTLVDLPQTGIVKEVYDGDTVLLSTGQSVRYLGIDTTEIGEEFHGKASELNRSLVMGKKIRLVYDKETVDKYKRLLAYVFVTVDGKEIFVNKRMIEEGYAVIYKGKPSNRYYKELLLAQQTAINNNKGFWPLHLLETENVYIGSKSSYVFHRKNCRGIKNMNPENRVEFTSKKEALLQGYSPCRSCKP